MKAQIWAGTVTVAGTTLVGVAKCSQLLTAKKGISEAESLEVASIA